MANIHQRFDDGNCCEHEIWDEEQSLCCRDLIVLKIWMRKIPRKAKYFFHSPIKLIENLFERLSSESSREREGKTFWFFIMFGKKTSIMVGNVYFEKANYFGTLLERHLCFQTSSDGGTREADNELCSSLSTALTAGTFWRKFMSQLSYTRKKAAEEMKERKKRA